MRLAELPPAAAWHVRGVLILGAVVLAAAGASFTALPTAWEATLAAGVGLACLALQVRSPHLVWRGARLAVHPDEAVLLLGFFALPPHLVLAAATVASVAGQAALRKPLLKAAFNVAVQAVATGAGAAAFLLLRAHGLDPLQAVLAVPLVVSGTNQLLVAMLLVRLTGEPWYAAFRPAILASAASAAVAGLLVGLLAVALFRLHPGALLLLVPAALLVHRALIWSYHQENELATRRTLNRAVPQMAEALDDETIVRIVLDACRDAFAPVAGGVRLVGTSCPAGAREWRLPPAAGATAARGRRLEEPVLDARGGTVGQVWLVLSQKEEAQLALDRERLKLVASQLGLSLSNARLLGSLQRSERRLRAAFDAVRDPVVVTSADGQPLDANARASALAPAAAASRDALWAALDEESRVRLLGAIGQGVTDRPVDLRTSGDGDAQRHFEADLARLPLEDRSEGFLVVARDVTERRRMEREAERQREALAQSERLSSLGIVVAGVAHEINNPLMYMGGSLDLALMDLHDLDEALRQGETAAATHAISEVRRHLDTIGAGASRIRRITHDLKVVAKTSEPVASASALDHVLDDVDRLVRPALPPHVVLDVRGVERGMRVQGEATELHQAFLNLVKNAIEALGERAGRVEVTARPAGGQALVCVRDDGPGIPADVRPKLFTPFFTTKPEGTGLGLSTVYAIVRKNGGSIDLESGARGGTTFTIRLPLREAGEPAAFSEPARTLAVRAWPGRGGIAAPAPAPARQAHGVRRPGETL